MFWLIATLLWLTAYFVIGAKVALNYLRKQGALLPEADKQIARDMREEWSPVYKYINEYTRKGQRNHRYKIKCFAVNTFLFWPITGFLMKIDSTLDKAAEKAVQDAINAKKLAEMNAQAEAITQAAYRELESRYGMDTIVQNLTESARRGKLGV